VFLYQKIKLQKTNNKQISMTKKTNNKRLAVDLIWNLFVKMGWQFKRRE